MKNHQHKIRLVLLLLLLAGVFTELRLQTFAKLAFGPYYSPIIWMFAGFLVCICAFLYSLRIPVSKFEYIPKKITLSRNVILWGSFLLGAIWCAVRLDVIFTDFPILAKESDVIPSLQYYVQRLLNGEIVYKPMPFEGYQVDPTYLPMLWLPYIFSEVLNIDYRWTAYAVFLLAIFLYHLKLLKQDIPIWELVFKSLVPFLIVYTYTQNASIPFRYAVELLPVGFYLILTLTVFHQNRSFMAIGILLCLLSRYAFTFWLPIYLLIYWIEKGFKKVFTVSMYVVVGVFFLYVLPFLSKDWTILTKGLDYYSKTAETQWQVQPWEGSVEKPYSMTNGFSLSVYFYDYAEGDVSIGLPLQRKVHILACALAATLLLVGYFLFRRHPNFNTKVYLIIGLKFYLIVFYGFLYVPFTYLYKVPLFMSVAVLYNLPLFRRVE